MNLTVFLLLTIVWGPGNTAPDISVRAETSMAGCKRVLASFDLAMARENEDTYPYTFRQDYAGECIQESPQRGPDIRGPI